MITGARGLLRRYYDLDNFVDIIISPDNTMGDENDSDTSVRRGTGSQTCEEQSW